MLPPQSTFRHDLLLCVYADGTPAPNGESFLVDNIEIFSTAAPQNSSLVRASNTEQPESYDGVSGILDVAVNNGQGIRAAFKLRNLLYFVKERSLHVTADDGVNEPALWSVEEISNKVGTPSAHGVGFGEEWVVIAGRAGLYLFEGGEPVKISQEIQPTWDSINWQYGHRIWVQVDIEKKRILVGVPLGTATEPSVVLVCDYTQGLGDPLAMLSAPGNSRKWTPWFISGNCCGIIERPSGVAQIYFGNNAANGKIYTLTPRTILGRWRGHQQLLHHRIFKRHGRGGTRSLRLPHRERPGLRHAESECIFSWRRYGNSDRLVAACESRNEGS